MIDEEREKFRSKALVYFNQLFNDELNLYHDLSEEAEKIFEREIPPTLAQEDILSFFEGLLEELSALVKKGHKRIQKIQAITEFQKEFLKSCEFFNVFVDFKEEKANLLKEIQSLTIPHSLFRDERIPSKIDAYVNEQYEKYLALQKEVPQFFEKMAQKRKNLLQICTYATKTVKRRLFEIFSNLTIFPDLYESSQKLRATLCSEIGTLQSLYFKGSSTSSELCQQLFDLAYEHDVQLLRNETAFRATRLQELRKQNIHLLQAMLTARRYLHISNILPQESIFIQVCTLCQDLERCLRQLENPAVLFQSCQAFEQVNEEFRRLWIQLESYEEAVQKCTGELFTLFSQNSEKIQQRLLRVADDLEEIEKERKKTRPNIVIFLQQALHDELIPLEDKWDVILDECTNLEKQFPYCQPLSFFMAVDDFLLRKKLFGKALKVDAKVMQAMQFAKTLQYIKTFEEERVDTILEVFERQYLIEDDLQDAQSAFKNYSEKLLQRAEFVEQEVVLDIGLLDMRSLFDVDEKKLQEALSTAIDKARQYVPDVLRDLEHLKGAAILEKKVQKALIQNITDWQQEKITGKENCRQLLNKVMLFCHFLFEAKMQLLKENTKNFSQLVSQMRAYVDCMEEFIEKKCEKKMAWISQMHAIRGALDALELIKEEPAAYKRGIEEIFKKIEEIPEIKRASEEEKIARCKLQDELWKHLESIKEEQIYHYVPGHLYNL